IRISLSQCISPEETSISLYVLDLDGDSSYLLNNETSQCELKRLSPLWPNSINLIIRSGWSVEQILHCTTSVLKNVYHLDIPIDR
ncbi:unnamed protein product, partial [Schistosoma turkestanicum]